MCGCACVPTVCRDALTVCIRNLEDYQLAVVLARLVEGNAEEKQIELPSSSSSSGESKGDSKSSSQLTWLLEQNLLPTAKENKDQWLEHITLWLLGRKEEAVRALVAEVNACMVLV